MSLNPQSYRSTEFIHRQGLATNRPNPADVLTGTLYFSTDTLSLERSNGTAWQVYAGSGTIVSHHTTHESGGSDPVILAQSQITGLETNLISLNSNVSTIQSNAAFKNVSNTFTQDQFIDGLVIANGQVISNDSIREHGRSTAIGHWIDVPFSAANFGATGGTWTVAGQLRFSYMLVGKTAFIQIYIDSSTVGGTPSSLNVIMPFTMVPSQYGSFYYNVAPNSGIGAYIQPSQDVYMRLYRDPFATPYTSAAGYFRISLSTQIV